MARKTASGKVASRRFSVLDIVIPIKTVCRPEAYIIVALETGDRYTAVGTISGTRFLLEERLLARSIGKTTADDPFVVGSTGEARQALHRKRLDYLRSVGVNGKIVLDTKYGKRTLEFRGFNGGSKKYPILALDYESNRVRKYEMSCLVLPENQN